jgi:hypothetical protein
MSSNSPARALATNPVSARQPRSALRLVASPESEAGAPSGKAPEQELKAVAEEEARLDVEVDVIPGVPDADGQVIFVDDWDSLSEEEALLASYGVPVAVPVGLNVFDIPAAAQATVDAVVVDSRRGELLSHLRFVEPLRARAVRLRYGLAGEKEHTLRQVGERMGISAATASRYVSDGIGELRLRFALTETN